MHLFNGFHVTYYIFTLPRWASNSGLGAPGPRACDREAGSRSSRFNEYYYYYYYYYYYES